MRHNDSYGNKYKTQCNAPTQSPTSTPTEGPTYQPTRNPTESPTKQPTVEPTYNPTEPTGSPSFTPTQIPTGEPTAVPTISPSDAPSMDPTPMPTNIPTFSPTTSPTAGPTMEANSNVDISKSNSTSSSENAGNDGNSQQINDAETQETLLVQHTFLYAVIGILCCIIVAMGGIWSYREKRNKVLIKELSSINTPSSRNDTHQIIASSSYNHVGSQSPTVAPNAMNMYNMNMYAMQNMNSMNNLSPNYGMTVNNTVPMVQSPFETPETDGNDPTTDLPHSPKKEGAILPTTNENENSSEEEDNGLFGAMDTQQETPGGLPGMAQPPVVGDRIDDEPGNNEYQ